MALWCWLLVSCGGGGGGGITLALDNGSGVGTGGTGVSMGTVTGFGSVVIDGTSYSSASPQYFAPSSQSEAAPAAPGDVVLGSQVQLELDAQGNPSSVTVAPDLVGAVGASDAGGFSVLGMRVRFNRLPAAGPQTYFSGLPGPLAVKPGMRVAVSGAYGLDASGNPFFQATLVERLPDTSTITGVSGVVAGLNSTAQTFQIGGTTVDYSGATQLGSSSARLANGQFVKVWSNQPLRNSGQTLAANSLRIRSFAGRSGAVQLSGLVFGLSGSGFALSAVPIDASALPTRLAGLSAGQYVTVQGQINAQTGAVVASSIASYVGQPVPTAIQGTITGYIAANSFFVRGVPVDASAATFLNGASAASLADGVYVSLVGAVGTANAGVVVASSLSVIGQPPTGETVEYRGSVSQLQSGSFVLTQRTSSGSLSTPISLAANLSFSNGSALQLVNGASVEVEATKSAQGLSAYSIAFIDAQPDDNAGSGGSEAILIHGRVEDLSASSMTVCAISIQLNGVVAQNGTLANGAKVEVWLSKLGGNYVARSIRIVN
ncbi:MAG: hypothetical protein HXX19_19220 [Rhodoferax sp.]|nr:hypothetical protein [Rhodoferax sp.]